MRNSSPRILKGIPKSFVTTATGKGNSNMRRARNMEMALLQHLKVCKSEYLRNLTHISRRNMATGEPIFLKKKKSATITLK